ncbi:hypothetical protein GGP57_003270 [Salinibacter ruber]|uniref:hypothetical protein n=1 Tax=Salinibacter ruber TaxID=146919 RepID=UPI002168EBD8|nr:hypothetical protein [Salinibacter ruber]MCS3635925.1 hypothetical protein [Salinibacter ruber]MCS3715400.1 hypothetical protein [Salinibacter ruber]
MASFKATDNPPELSSSEWPPKGENWNAGKRYFYIDADTSRGWPRESKTALCKFGVTGRKPEDRCEENERVLQEEWGIETDLEVVFIATGRITGAEKEIADHTRPWLPDAFQENAEWRRCPPRELARMAILIAEDRQR